MAARTKAKPKTTAPSKARLYTWAVNIDGAVTRIEAAGILHQDGAIEFIDADDQLVLIVAPGHWSTCTIEPGQD